ncbi:hypothetical protein [Methanobacterium sp. BAmetb5]|uniref:hypothetical protein n=1 Tax=Methanobacterium sp. BAmetb5 TaxID=2025351 RepID=UPI0025EAEE74|nr:hypothetical protein [Methanobacterium sp. BAmetb5]
MDRYSRGWEKLKEIDGEAGEAVVESLKDITPDLAIYIIEFSLEDSTVEPEPVSWRRKLRWGTPGSRQLSMV